MLPAALTSAIVVALVRTPASKFDSQTTSCDRRMKTETTRSCTNACSSSSFQIQLGKSHSNRPQPSDVSVPFVFLLPSSSYTALNESCSLQKEVNLVLVESASSID